MEKEEIKIKEENEKKGNEKKNEIILVNPKQKKASEKNVATAKNILRLGMFKKLVDAFMLSVNKSNKKGVKEAANKLINACINVADKLDENIEEGKKIGLNAEKGISDENVESFDTAYLTVLRDLSESSDKKEKKLATSMSNAFPHWCLSLAKKLQDSNFYKRLSNAEDKNKNTNTNKDDGKAFDVAKKENSNGVMYELKKKYKNLFSGKARKHETFNKIKNLVVRYSEPWAIAWVNAVEDDDPISESSAIKEINALCKKKDVDFIQDLGNKDGFILAGSFNSIFGKNFKENSGKIKKSLKSIIDRLVSISKKLTNKKYKGEDAQKISGAINTYKNDAVFKAVMAEPGILSKAWGKITTAASTVGGGIKTAGGKVLSGAKAVGSGIVKGGKLLGKGVLAVATAPKYIVPGKIRNKIYGKFHKKKEEEVELNNKA